VLKVIAALEKESIQPRRYFYPSLNKLKFLEYQTMPVSESISQRILCLPLYPDLSESDVSLTCRIINKTLRG
jgi:dTDP-4-amino-4,6-dideoxygalactose transaminase